MTENNGDDGLANPEPADQSGFPPASDPVPPAPPYSEPQPYQAPPPYSVPPPAYPQAPADPWSLGGNQPPPPSVFPPPPGGSSAWYPPSAPGYGQGQQFGAAAGIAKPASNLVWAILTTLVCCLPLGVVSIVYAAQVDQKWANGDFVGAQASSAKAKNFAIFAGAAALAGYLLMFVIFVISIALSGGTTTIY